MEGKLKVIFCTDGVFPHLVGGIQRHTRLLVEQLAQNNNTDLIVIHTHKGIKVFDNPNIKEFSISPLPGKKHYLREKYDMSRDIFEIVNQYPDYIIYAQGITIWYGIKSLSHRLIFNPHGLEAFQTLTRKEWLKLIPFRVILRYIFNHSATVISLGGRLTTIIENNIRNSKTAIAVLPNAVNLSKKPSEGIIKRRINSPIHCLFVGRFAFNKGIDVMMEAVKILHDAGESEEFIFSLAGKGPLFESYKQQYAYPNVNFLGFVSDEDLFGLYETCDIFVLPTLFEGMPTVILEAMTEGMPVIVTDVGATRELVDESNGFIIEKKNALDLVAKLRAFYDSTQEVKAEMSAASLERVRTHFTWQRVAKLHEDLFASLYTNLQKR